MFIKRFLISSRFKNLKGDNMITLFTDTSANLTKNITDEYNIKVIPFGYTVNGEEISYKDTVDFDGKKFYDAMRGGADVKTSMINISLISESLEEELKQGNDVIYITMSGGISGTALVISSRWHLGITPASNASETAAKYVSIACFLVILSFLKM